MMAHMEVSFRDCPFTGWQEHLSAPGGTVGDHGTGRQLCPRTEHDFQVSRTLPTQHGQMQYCLPL